uniref:Secreted protein n=1 Tax=Vitis vinifera TaxID=29760 RepID=A5BI91_VITVI|nr:hypothetical protein VITISV_003306 [Vitis vinifera]
MACLTTLLAAARLLPSASSPQLPDCPSHLAGIHEQNSHGVCEIFAHLRGVCEFRTPFAHHSHTFRTPGAVVFRRPYLPHFSSKSYTV